jgi:hypothetical protein
VACGRRQPHPPFSPEVFLAAKVLEVAAQLGISGRSKMPENELISEILRLAPELAAIPQEEKER